MRSLLPGFRLLTLKPSDATRLSYFLTTKEEVHLLRYFITEELDFMPTTLCTRFENRQSTGIVKQVILDHVLRSASKESGWKNCRQNALCITTNLSIWLTKVTIVKGKAENKIELKYYVNGKLKGQVETVLFADEDYVCELKCVEPILLEKGAQIRLYVNCCDYNNAFPVVPYSVLDLNSCGAVTRAHFKQLHFASTTEPIILHSFTYKIVCT
jgi:hypothetical protein